MNQVSVGLVQSETDQIQAELGSLVLKINDFVGFIYPNCCLFGLVPFRDS